MEKLLRIFFITFMITFLVQILYDKPIVKKYINEQTTLAAFQMTYVRMKLDPQDREL